MPIEAQGKPWSIDTIRQTWLDLLHDVEDKQKRILTAETVQLRTVAESLFDEANGLVYQFRRDVASLFLFMLKACASEFPVDVLTALRGPLDTVLSDCVEDVNKLRSENKQLRMEVVEAKKRLEEFTILWNNAAVPMKAKQ